MSVILQFKRGTRAQIDNLAAEQGLKVGEPLLVLDEERIAVALDVNSYVTFAKESEVVAATATSLASMTDVNTTGASNGHLLSYVSATSKWQPTFDPNNQRIDGGNF